MRLEIKKNRKLQHFDQFRPNKSSSFLPKLGRLHMNDEFRTFDEINILAPFSSLSLFPRRRPKLWTRDLM